MGPKMDLKARNIVLLHQKYLFCAESLFAEYILPEEVIQNKVSLRGSPEINFFPTKYRSVLLYTDPVHTAQCTPRTAQLSQLDLVILDIFHMELGL